MKTRHLEILDAIADTLESEPVTDRTTLVRMVPFQIETLPFAPPRVPPSLAARQGLRGFGRAVLRVTLRIVAFGLLLGLGSIAALALLSAILKDLLP